MTRLDAPEPPEPARESEAHDLWPSAEEEADAVFRAWGPGGGRAAPNREELALNCHGERRPHADPCACGNAECGTFRCTSCGLLARWCAGSSESAVCDDCAAKAAP